MFIDMDPEINMHGYIDDGIHAKSYKCTYKNRNSYRYIYRRIDVYIYTHKCTYITIYMCVYM